MISAYLSHIGDLAPLLNLIGWWFIPGYVSMLVQSIFYRICPSRRPIPPVYYLNDASKTTTTTSTSTNPDNENKPIYNPIFELQDSEYRRRCRRHRSVVHGLVICLYLGYSLISAYQEQSGKNHYSTLGIESNSLFTDSIPTSGSSTTPSSSNNTPASGDDSHLDTIKTWFIKGDLLDQAGLKYHWRKLARTLHPDKLAPPANLKTESDLDLWKSNVEAKFISMREAYETLSDSSKHWAYDRFGPTISQWKNCVTHREYLLEGLKQSVPFYGFSSASLIFVGGLKKADSGTFWRWTVFLFAIGVEMMILTSKTMPMSAILICKIFPNRAQFELIELIRKFFMASSCVATQLSAILYPHEDELKKKESVDQVVQPLLGLVHQLHDYSALAHVELVKLILNDLYPIIRNTSDEDDDHHFNALSAPHHETSLKTSELEDLRVQKVIAEVKEKMLDTFCDLKLQSDDVGQAAWIDAVKNS